jgi:lysozyme
LSLRDDLVRDEGIRLKPYRCTAGKLTIGVGRNLDDNGISRPEALALLDNDIARVKAECERTFAWFGSLDSVRQEVVLNMVFNLGITRFSQFHQTIQHIQKGDYSAAADQMLKSLWAKQVSARATRLATKMRWGQ